MLQLVVKKVSPWQALAVVIFIFFIFSLLMINYFCSTRLRNKLRVVNIAISTCGAATAFWETIAHTLTHTMPLDRRVGRTPFKVIDIFSIHIFFFRFFFLFFFVVLSLIGHRRTLVICLTRFSVWNFYCVTCTFVIILGCCYKRLLLAAIIFTLYCSNCFGRT